MLQWTLRYICHFRFWSFQGLCPAVGLLGPHFERVVNFGNTPARLFSSLWVRRMLYVCIWHRMVFSSTDSGARHSGLTSCHERLQTVGPLCALAAPSVKQHGSPSCDACMGEDSWGSGHSLGCEYRRSNPVPRPPGLSTNPWMNSSSLRLLTCLNPHRYPYLWIRKVGT